jgi:site-specific DNA-methyltransferase (adenine-specific)
MKQIPDNSVDLILCDLPYGTTACKWDSIIPFEPLWEQYRRICKPKAAIVLTASQPFTSALVMSNPKEFAFSWSWDKVFGGNFVQAKRQPIKTHEDILVFCSNGGQPNYYPQMTKREKSIKAGKVTKQPNSAIPNASSESAITAVKAKIYDEKYPVSIIQYSNRDAERGLHPTQKPVALFEYLIKTYSKPGELVLDNCAGSGTTGVAARNTGRNFILIEKEPEYVEVCKKRLELT